MSLSHEGDTPVQAAETEQLTLTEFEPLQPIIIQLDGRNAFHAILTNPETGEAVVRPWVGGGQQNAGFPDRKSTIGTRPYIEGTMPAIEPTDTDAHSNVAWGTLTFGEELVLRDEEGGDRTIFTGHTVETVSAAATVAA